ncbi:proprotein convertase subtilisin/kexin type 5-like [Sycon ciliatum]|uniref:proprotein convertase subtilisin/kexin type 5-like n=1 Tax=Sycon ciliatum TaxID=27933 RepID=UPI0031F6B703
MTCTLCKPSTLILPGSRGSGCVTSCPPGFRADTSGSLHRCEPCNAELLCAACTESAGACSSCDGGRVLLASGQCADQCPDGYAVDGLGKTCQRCSVPGCVDCTNDAQSCAMCSEDMLRLTVAGSVSCVASCPAGYFGSEGARECQPCASECKSCTTAADSCSSCQPSLLLHGSVCLRGCPQETFAQSKGGVCVACDPSCALCRGPGANDCARCSESGYKVDMLYGCVSSTCRQGQYANATHCIPCSTVCAECNGSAEQCTACPTGKSLMHAQCLDACLSGFVEDLRGMCVECKRNCAACAPGKVRLAGECVQGCPAHGNARVNSVCVKCVDASCRLCPRSADQCLDCQLPNRYLLEGHCVATCPAGQFAYGRNICSTCHSSCAACVSDSPDSCTACHRPSVLQSGSCLSTCDDGFFPQAVAAVGGVKLRAAVCTACNARYLHCESAGVCTTCKTGFALAAGSKTCVSECNAGEVLDVSAQRCIACPPGCSTCSQSGKCTRCQGQRWVHHGQCLLECPPRFYPESATGARCRKCHAGCATCSGPSVCRTCIAGLFRHADGLCRAECPSGEYIHRDGGACHRCNSLCLTCAGPGESDCVQCKAVLPNGWYSRQDGSCGRCHASCKACAGTATKCVSCRASQKLVNGVCLEVPTSCGSSHYLDKKIGRCLPCADNCEQCSNDGGAVVCDRCAVTHRKSPVDGRCYPCCTVSAISTTPPCCACSPDDSALTCSPGSFSTAPSSTSESSTHGSSQVVEVVHRNRQGVQPTARPDDEDVRMRAKRPGGVGGGTDQAHTSRNVAARAVAVVVAGIVAFLAVIYCHAGLPTSGYWLDTVGAVQATCRR